MTLRERGKMLFYKLSKDIQDIVIYYLLKENRENIYKCMKELCEVLNSTEEVFSFWREEDFPSDVKEIVNVYEFKKRNIRLSKQYGHFCMSCIVCDDCLKSHRDSFYCTCRRSFSGSRCHICKLWVCSKCCYKEEDNIVCPECINY